MKIKTRRLGLALTAVSATIALSGIGAGGAQAALNGPCMGTAITGLGSSLQNPAQQIWTGAGTGFTGSTLTGSCGTTTGKVTYDSASSGGCLTALAATTDAINKTYAFCGTDDAPNTAQITTSNGVSTTSLLSIPVTQTAIAVVANPPTGCTVSFLTAAQVETAFRGAATSWTSLGGSGTCESAVTPIVRADSSGTTYQLKHYLTSANTAVVHNSLRWGGPSSTTTLQSIPNNQTWPGSPVRSASGCATATTLAGCTGAAGTGSGGGDEVRTVAATTGSIGYAALPDARSVTIARTAGGISQNAKWVPLRVGASNVNPSSNGLSTTKDNANCPTGTGAYGVLPAATASWADTYISTAGAYPLCTLTWDLAFTDYAAAGYTGSGGVARSVRDYLHYALLGGQTAQAGNDYRTLPSDVVTTGTTGVTSITG